MNIFTESVVLGGGYEKNKFFHMTQKIENNLQEQQLTSDDVIWLQSSSDRYITLTAIVG